MRKFLLILMAVATLSGCMQKRAQNDTIIYNTETKHGSVFIDDVYECIEKKESVPLNISGEVYRKCMRDKGYTGAAYDPIQQYSLTSEDAKNKSAVRENNPDEYKYPIKTDNIVDIYNKLSKIKKDEFTTDEEFSIIVNNYVKKINNDKNIFVFKASQKKYVDGSILPLLSYKIDKKSAILSADTSSFSYSEFRYKHSIYYGTSYAIISRTSSKMMTGQNAFGVKNTFEMETGEKFGLYFKNYNSSYSDIDDLSVEDAKRLKNNLDVFFVVAITSDGDLPPSLIGVDSYPPKIDTLKAWNIKLKVVPAKLKAILLCDKKKKEVVRTIHFAK